MALDLNEARERFAHTLATDPAGRWRMDYALARVVEWAFQQGMLEAAKSNEDGLAHD